MDNQISKTWDSTEPTALEVIFWGNNVFGIFEFNVCILTELGVSGAPTTSMICSLASTLMSSALGQDWDSTPGVEAAVLLAVWNSPLCVVEASPEPVIPPDPPPLPAFSRAS